MNAKVVAALALTAMVMAPQGAVAYGEKPVGQVGKFKILKITEDGKSVHRCSAHINGQSGALRLAFMRDRKHAMSFPGRKGAPMGVAEVTLDSKPPLKLVPDLVDVRTSMPLDYPTVDRIMATKMLINIKFDGKNQGWNVGGTNMEAVYRALTNCVSSTY